ncbi:MAG TPA: 16S rRNA methyltransferase [Phycisphaerae bacterium]|nr:16S rRNA methyltransferase [Phycisphaerae bacterium]
MSIQTDKIVDRVSRSRKYRFLCRDTIERIARWAAERSRSQDDALKRTRRKLHQVYGAYVADWDADKADAALDALGPAPDERALKGACRKILGMHASTRERMAMLETFYAEVLAITGPPGRVLDLGCGLHPFALPWMGLPPAAAYTAWDVDGRAVALANRLLAMLARPGAACCKDVLVDPPEEQVDVVFLLKMIPCLEQQQPGCSAELIRRLKADFVVASFPVRSIGGRWKNMAAHYRGVMDRMLAELPCDASLLECAQELVYVMDKRGRVRKVGSEFAGSQRATEGTENSESI